MAYPRIRLIVVSLLLLGGALAARFLTARPAEPVYEYVLARRADVIQKVSVTGTVKPADRVNLAFEQGGRIARVTATVNAKVRRGEVLVSLEQAELHASLRQAQAGVASAAAQVRQEEAAAAAQREKLRELERGSRPEQRRITAAQLGQAEQDLTNEYAAVPDTLRDAYTRAEETVRLKTIALFSTTAVGSYQVTYVSCDLAGEQDAVLRRQLSEDALQQWQRALGQTTAATPRSELAAALQQATAHLTVIAEFLEVTSRTLHTACARQDTTLDGPRTNVAAAQTAVVAARSAINRQQQDIAAQAATVQRIQRELELVDAGTAAEQVGVQGAAVRQAEAAVAARRAQLEQAEALVATSQAQLGKTTLRAPFDGLVTAVEARVGEIVSPNLPLVTIISAGAFEITAHVPEADIAKVALRQAATVTLDAYGDDVTFPASVTAIDPAETVIEGVPTYTITLQFTQPDVRIRSGLTADVEILTNRRDQVISIPQRAVYNRNGERWVKILERASDGTPTAREVAVKTGLKGSDGTVEITQGLEEGARVITGKTGKKIAQ